MGEEMLLSIESQFIPVIALLAFGICYAVTVVIFLVAAVLSFRGIATDLKATSPPRAKRFTTGMPPIIGSTAAP